MPACSRRDHGLRGTTGSDPLEHQFLIFKDIGRFFGFGGMEDAIPILFGLWSTGAAWRAAAQAFGSIGMSINTQHTIHT